MPGKTCEVENVEEAIELASRLKVEGKFDFFRGQVQTWPPHSSLLRLQQRDPNGWQASVLSKLDRFQRWIEDTAGLEPLRGNEDAQLAVAQHYGMPTHFIDFTSDPAVAGFFASDAKDGAADNMRCIYCLNSTDFLSFWKLVLDSAPTAPKIELLQMDVPNLWRLEAQRGVFLHAPTNWDLYWPMDKIIFPHGGYPSYPGREIVYPDRKSQLEILLDGFFSLEVRRENQHRMKRELSSRLGPIQWRSMDAHPVIGVVRGNRLEHHSSWRNADKWLAIGKELHDDVLRVQVALVVDLSASGKTLRQVVRNGVLRALERDAKLRRHAVVWKLQTDSPEGSSKNHSELLSGLAAIWDGIRSLPYSNEDVAMSLGTFVALHRMGFPFQAGPWSSAESAAPIMGESIRIELGGSDNSVAKAFVGTSALRAALRSDLSEYFEKQYLETPPSLPTLLLSVSDPRQLFDFDKLISVYCREIVPTQISNAPPHLFNPARLRILGLP